MSERKQKKTKPTELDKKRISETIVNTDRFNKIEDNESFNEAYDDYFAEYDYWIKTKHLRTEIRGIVFGIKDITLKPKEPTKVIKPIPPKRVFDLIGREKGRIVKARKTFVIVRSKRQIRYRDRKGRFVSVKRK